MTRKKEGANGSLFSFAADNLIALAQPASELPGVVS